MAGRVAVHHTGHIAYQEELVLIGSPIFPDPELWPLLSMPCNLLVSTDSEPQIQLPQGPITFWTRTAITGGSGANACSSPGSACDCEHPASHQGGSASPGLREHSGAPTSEPTEGAVCRLAERCWVLQRFEAATL